MRATGGGVRLREVAVRSAAVLVAGALGIGVLAVLGVGELDASAASFTGDVSLTTDTGGSALFQAEGLAPGETLTTCVEVSYVGAELPVQLRLHGASGGVSDLDEHLVLRVEAGEGGGFGGCDGFVGVERYVGTLAGFLADHGTDAASVPVAALDAPEPVTFRFSVVLDGHPAAQGRTSTAAYTWTAWPVAGVPPTGPTDPVVTDPPPVDPVVTDPAPADPVVTDPPPADPVVTDPAPADPVADPPGPAPEGPVDPDGTSSEDTIEDRSEVAPTDPEGSEPRTPPTSDDLGPSSGPDDASAAPAGVDEPTAAGLTWERVLRVLRFAAERSSYLLLLLLVVAAFLAIQDRIDRKDPKLALAPRAPDLDLRFEPPPSREGDA